MELNILTQYMQHYYGISDRTIDFFQDAEKQMRPVYDGIEQVCDANQAKVLNAFQQEQVGLRHFAPTSGYGYDDIGRDTLDRVFARVFECEDALVRPQFASGTHAIALALFGLLMPGDVMLSATGSPYDTLEEAIGISGNAWGSLKQFGIHYKQVDLTKSSDIDTDTLLTQLSDDVTLVYFQRSRGYAWRKALTVAEIEKAISIVKTKRPEVCCVVDNCYGEFTDTREPTGAGADIICGSLIKNAGGGIAPTGAYIAGKSACIKKIANRMTSPGIGREVGSYDASYRPFYQGLFMAPHVTAESLKGMSLAAKIWEKFGYETMPASADERNDIIQAMRFPDAQSLIRFCQNIQKASPIDSHVTPEPWAMPGYQDPVIMAAGGFVQGASIELSADAPIREPYTAYMQGGLTYSHVKIALMTVVEEIFSETSKR